MTTIRNIFFLLLVGLSTSAQTIEDLTFGTDSTFEVMTWNIEWFPKNGQVTVDYVSDIIEALDVDLLAIQEVEDVSEFEQMLDNLDSYNGYLESVWFAGLAYIYKTAVMQVNDIVVQCSESLQSGIEKHHPPYSWTALHPKQIL